MVTRLSVLCAAFVLLFAGSARAAIVSISNFSGGNSLDNVSAVASSEYPAPQFVIESAFDADENKNWAANGGSDSTPKVTLDLSAATINGIGGPFVIDTFTWVERRSAGLPSQDQTKSFRLQAYVGGEDGTLVFDTTIEETYETWSNGVSVTVNLGGVEADTIVYTVLKRGDEDKSGNVGANAFRLTGSLVPEPASLALIGLGGLLMLHRRR